MKEKFRVWMTNKIYGKNGKTYSNRTIEHYITGLETIKNEFNINFWELSNIEEIIKKREEILENKEFSKKNDIGNKMYSCSIDRYIDFIYDENNYDIKETIQEIEKDDLLSYEEKNKYIETICNIRNPQFQRIFKQKLNDEFECKCALCGINDKRLLIASHIIPYSDCENKSDMYRSYNGLLLCANHDILFDKHLISFDENGKMYISSSIKMGLYEFLNIDNKMTLDNKYMTDERKKCITTHFNTFKSKNGEN